MITDQKFTAEDFDALVVARKSKINAMVASISLDNLEDEIDSINIILNNMDMSVFEDKLLECESHRDRCLQIETEIRQIRNYVDDSFSQLSSLGLLFADGKSKEIREAQVLSWLIPFYDKKSIIDKIYLKINSKRISLDKKMEVLSRWLTAETSLLHMNPRKGFYDMQKKSSYGSENENNNDSGNWKDV